jgi:cell division protein FtsB
MSISMKMIKKGGFLGLMVVLIVVIFSLVRSLLGYLKLDDRFLVAETEVEKLEEENRSLGVTLYEEDRDFVMEKELRDSLGFSRQGEVVVVLPDGLVDKTIEERKQEEVNEEQLPNWKNWWDLFF